MKMKAAVLVEVGRIEIRDLPVPTAGPQQVLVRTTGVGICGTDLHIYRGSANYNRDPAGRPVPLSSQPQILGHEIAGTVEEVGREVRDLKAGDRVVVDQGLNCSSQRIEPLCEYCSSGDSHQCLYYKEHGITGLPGGFAQYLAIPAVNAHRVEGSLTSSEMPLAEPLGCVLHALEFVERGVGRYSLTGDQRARNVLILGSGPAGLLFLQYLRNVIEFEGPIYVADINPEKLRIAREFGATVLEYTGDELVREVMERTQGERIHYLVEATGAGAVFGFLPGLLRKQATVILYGHGHEGAEMTQLNALQFLEPHLFSPVGASGALGPDGRSLTYRKAIDHLLSGRVRTRPLISHPCTLEALPQVFEHGCLRSDFMKAVALPE